jgi:uroporphyrinogen decarboxylase
MNSRERVLLAIRRRKPDRVPFNMRFTDAVVKRFRAETGAADDDYEAYFHHDLRRVGLRLPPKPKELPRSEWFPEPAADAIAECAAKAGQLREQGFAVFSAYVCGVFEEAKEWVGDETVLTLPFEDPDRLEAMLERITRLKMTLYGAYARAGVDIVHIGDDLGTQNSLIMSPEQYRRWYRPRHRRIIEHLRGIKPDVLIAFHCCGHVTPLLPDLIELGVDILEAVQPETMDIGELKRQYGRDITFWGGVGNQSVLARLKPDEVVASVRRTLALMSPGGGYLASPCHTITEDIPWENVLAFVKAVREGAES